LIIVGLNFPFRSTLIVKELITISPFTCSRSGISKKDNTEDESGDIEDSTRIDRMSGKMIPPPMGSFTVPGDQNLFEYSQYIFANITLPTPLKINHSINHQRVPVPKN